VQDFGLISFLCGKVSKGEGAHRKKVDGHILAEGTVEIVKFGYMNEKEIERFGHSLKCFVFFDGVIDWRILKNW
jgi:hypothetical protein